MKWQQILKKLLNKKYKNCIFCKTSQLYTKFKKNTCQFIPELRIKLFALLMAKTIDS